MPDKLRPVIITVVSLVWAANFAAPIFVKDYEPAPELNVAFMAILGMLTASGTKAKQQQPESSDEPTRRYKPRHRA